MESVIIIGGGPAGLTAGIYCGRAGLKPLLLTGDKPGGLLTETALVENFPGFAEPVDGPELMSRMMKQAERSGVRIEYDRAAAAELSDGGVQHIKTASGMEIDARSLIIASGAVPRRLAVPAAKRFLNHGLSACAVCDGAFFAGMPVAVVGGGDSALEEAMLLARFAAHVFVIHRRDRLRASQIMAERAMAEPKITFIWDSVVENMFGETELTGLLLRNVKTGNSVRLDCRGCFTALGHEPDTALFRRWLKLDRQGYIVTADGTSRTSCKGVFACGDCADPHYRQAVTAAGSGCRAAMDAERFLNGAF